MNSELESRIDQAAAALRIRYDRRVLLVSFAGCFVICTIFFVWYPPAFAQDLWGGGEVAFLLIGIPAVSFLANFFFQLMLVPFIDSYYAVFRRKSHTDLAVATVLGEELRARRPGYLETARALLNQFQPNPKIIFPEVSRAFKRLLDAESLVEAQDLGEQLGLSNEIINQARRRLLGDWESHGEDSREIAKAKKSADELLADFETIEGLVTHLVSGESVASQTARDLLEKQHAGRLAALRAMPLEAIRSIFASSTVIRLAQIHVLFGKAYVVGEDRYLARHHLERALELDPANPETRLMLSRLHYELQNFDMALGVIEAHLSRFPDDAVAIFHMEDCIRQLGRT